LLVADFRFDRRVGSMLYTAPMPNQFDAFCASGHFAAAAGSIEAELTGTTASRHPYRATDGRASALTRAALQTRLGACYWQLARFDVAEQHLVEALATRERWQATGEEIAETVGRLAAVHHYVGRMDSARAGFERAVRLCEGGDDPCLRAIAVRNLGAFLRDRGDKVSARGHLDHALDVLESRHGRAHPDVAAAYKARAYLDASASDSKTALRSAQQALEVSRAAHADEHPWVAAAQLLLGRAYTRLHSFGKAERSLARAQLVFTSSHGPTHPMTAITVSACAALAWERKDRERAEELARDAVQRYRVVYDGHQFMAGMLHKHASYLVWLGRLEEAETQLALGLSYTPAEPSWRRTRCGLLRAMSEVRLHLGDEADAERLTAEAAALDGPDDPADDVPVL
jgi:tetratricopeptide (TPR) repeat protein